MANEEPSPLTPEQREAVFLALVEAMRATLDLTRARRLVARRFGVTEQEVRRIEEEGVEGRWPPLG